MKQYQFGAVIVREGKWFVARCLQLPVTSQGRTLAKAKANTRPLKPARMRIHMAPSCVQKCFETTTGAIEISPPRKIAMRSSTVATWRLSTQLNG